jgi:hypothetical protein
VPELSKLRASVDWTSPIEHHNELCPMPTYGKVPRTAMNRARQGDKPLLVLRPFAARQSNTPMQRSPKMMD